MRFNSVFLSATFHAVFALLLATQSGEAGDWGSWRGPTSNGISNEKDVPTVWSPEKNVAWRVELPGPSEQRQSCGAIKSS